MTRHEIWQRWRNRVANIHAMAVKDGDILNSKRSAIITNKLDKLIESKTKVR